MASPEHIHNRYERSPDGSLCIDVAADKAEDLYNNFDRDAPYIRRDLSEDLTDYLNESAAELLPHAFAIRFTFSQHHDEDTLTRIRNSIATFFLYMAEQERRMLRRLLIRSGIFLLVGITILVVSVVLNRTFGAESGIVDNVFAEGVNIAAWVALWEALAVFLVDWYPHRRQLRINLALANAPLLFR